MVEKELRVAETSDDLTLARAFVVSCFRCYAGRIKKSSVPYDFSVQQAAISPGEVGDHKYRDYNKTEKVWVQLEGVWKKYSQQSIMAIPKKVKPFYACSLVLIGKERDFNSLGESIRASIKRGNSSIDGLVDGLLEQQAA